MIKGDHDPSACTRHESRSYICIVDTSPHQLLLLGQRRQLRDRKYRGEGGLRTRTTSIRSNATLHVNSLYGLHDLADHDVASSAIAFQPRAHTLAHTQDSVRDCGNRTKGKHNRGVPQLLAWPCFTPPHPHTPPELRNAHDGAHELPYAVARII